jgi:hypothetical protein
MFVRSLVTLAFASLAIARALPLLARDEKHWRPDFEPYAVYHARYMEIGCNTHHNTTFFNTCCHPREKNVDLDTIPEECLGSGDYCEGDGENTPTPSFPLPVNPTPTTNPPIIPPSLLPTTLPIIPTSILPVDPTPTTKHSTTTHTTHKPTPTSNPGGNTLTGSGHGTFFYQNDTPGACGKIHADSSKVVALDSKLYTKHNYCGKTIHITNTKNGKTVTAIVADECPTCESKGSVDMSVGAFTAIATESQGDVPITWTIDL